MERLEYCYECNKDVNPTIKTEKNKYTYRGKEFLVVEEVHYCPKCGNILINDNFDNDMYKIYDCYLKLFNLSFEKIKEIRIKLNLSQEVFSKILGWSKKSIVRYENSDSVPQGEYLNTYMILNENPYYIVKLLERQKNNFTEEEYYKILSILPFSKVYKTVNTILYLLKNNKLCETSLMKHLFAVDDYIKIEINDISTNFTTDKDFDKKLFTKEELNSMKLIKYKFKEYSASELSDWSHSFKGYIDTKNGEIIDYKYAKYLDIDNI